MNYTELVRRIGRATSGQIPELRAAIAAQPANDRAGLESMLTTRAAIVAQPTKQTKRKPRKK